MRVHLAGVVQAQKFAAHGSEEAGEAVEAIRKAESPEEAARMGRRLERRKRELVSAPTPVSHLQEPTRDGGSDPRCRLGKVGRKRS